VNAALTPELAKGQVFAMSQKQSDENDLCVYHARRGGVQLLWQTVQAQEKIIGYQDIYTQAFQFQLNLCAIDVLFIKAF
jgi:hypothetical protein